MKRVNLARMAGVLAVLMSQAITGQTALACGSDGSGFLPENSLQIPVGHGNSVFDAGMTEQKFNSILDKISGFYAPIISQQGGQLQIQRLWTDGTVNAYADRQGSTWIIKMYGGLARHQAMTDDGFALVACHELGHHLGGVPRYTGSWAATEGEADYFATVKCLRRVWDGDDNATIVKSLGVPAEVSAGCEKSFADKNTIAVCEREAMAGLSSGNLSQALDGSSPVSFNTPDPSVVQQTFERHPKAQCRLDTYYQASLCQISFKEEIGQADPTVGVCSSEKGDKFGYRPFCWYKPGGGGNPNPNPNPQPGGDVAPAPTINGQTDIMVPVGARVVMDYNVSGFAQSDGVYMEVVINRDFMQPNGVQPDPARAFYGMQAGKQGRFITNPLPAGIYRYRVIPLGGNGSYAVGRFSNASTLRVQ